jgi:pimeloyl-ACP methyl ester carboxylesterase
MPSFDSAGVSIHYEVFGTGRPIVLVHGLFSDIEGNWVTPGWIDALTPVRQVIAMDCRGHGRSGKPHEVAAYANEEMSQDVLRLMDHLAIEKADVLGYSMGSEIAVPLLLRHGERLSSVILGGFGDFAGDWEAVTPDIYLVDDPDAIEHPYARGVRKYADSIGADLQAIAAYQAGYRPPLDGAPVIGDDVPVCVVKGADDDVGSLDGLFAAVPHAQLIEIPGRDHLTVVGDPRFKQAVLDFLT